MKRDLALTDHAGGCDITIANADISLAEGLGPAIRLSVLSDARAAEVLPKENPRGFWAQNIGSLIWRYSREKATPTTARRIEAAAIDSLEWLKKTGEATDIAAAADLSGDRLSLKITISTPEGTITETLRP